VLEVVEELRDDVFHDLTSWERIRARGGGGHRSRVLLRWIFL